VLTRERSAAGADHRGEAQHREHDRGHAVPDRAAWQPPSVGASTGPNVALAARGGTSSLAARGARVAPRRTPASVERAQSPVTQSSFAAQLSPTSDFDGAHTRVPPPSTQSKPAGHSLADVHCDVHHWRSPCSAHTAAPQSAPSMQTPPTP
jgi:hypothetical protein